MDICATCGDLISVCGRTADECEQATYKRIEEEHRVERVERMKDPPRLYTSAQIEVRALYHAAIAINATNPTCAIG